MEKFGQEVAAPSDLQPSTINWAALHKAAVDLPDDPPAEPAPPKEEPLPTVTEFAEKLAKTPEPQEATPTEKAPEPPAPREFKDDDLVKIKVDGEEKVVTYKDYKDGIQREAVFTKRMQQLAQQREAAEQELAQRYAQLYQESQRLEHERQRIEANNPLAKLVKQLEAQEKVEQDPNTLATIGEIQRALKEQREQLQTELTQREQAQREQLAQAAAQLRVQQAQAQDAARFTAALQETLSDKDLAVVKSVVPSPELADAIIRYNVAQMGPNTIEEGIEFMRTFVKQWADSVKGQQKTEDSRAAAVKARAVIEPPQGSPPAPTTSSKPQSFFKKDGGLDWGALHQKALAQMEG